MLGILAVLLASDDSQIRLLVDDMTLPHVAKPSGVPDSVDWSARPRLGMGNNPGKWEALTAWGQAYLPAGGSTPVNVRVAVRNIQTWFLSKRTGKWSRVQFAVPVEGAAYVEDFVDDKSKPIDQRDEPGGYTSVVLEKGHNFHFWPAGSRHLFDPKDVGGVISAFQARLVAHDPAKPADFRAARILMGAGLDYWEKGDSKWDQWKTNGDAGIGRFRWITPEWQWYTMSTLGEAELRKNPPPAFSTHP